MHYGRQDIGVFYLMAAILRFRLPVSSVAVGNNPIEMFDIGNGTRAIVISFLSSVEAEILLRVAYSPMDGKGGKK